MDCWTGGFHSSAGWSRVDRSSLAPAIAPVAVVLTDPPPSTAVVKSTVAVKKALWRTGSSVTRDGAAEKKLFSPYIREAIGKNALGEKRLSRRRLRFSLTIRRVRKRPKVGEKSLGELSQGLANQQKIFSGCAWLTGRRRRGEPATAVQAWR